MQTRPSHGLLYTTALCYGLRQRRLLIVARVFVHAVPAPLLELRVKHAIQDNGKPPPVKSTVGKNYGTLA